MRLRISVSAEGPYFNGGAAIEISDPMSRCFAPMKSGDAGVFSALAGDLCTEEVKVLMKTREDAAEYIAKHLAGLLVEEMKKHDTHNGYEAKERELSAIEIHDLRHGNGIKT